MDFRSRRRLRRSPPPRRGPGGDDFISPLPDDMLLQILLCLRCTRAAARTGARLPGLTFRDVPAGVVKAALGCVPRRTSMSLLNVRLTRSVSKASRKLDDAHAKMLLRAAERLSPEELVFILPREIVFKPGPPASIVMPCFRRATSIELDTGFLCVKPPQVGGKLPALERLSSSLRALESLSLSGNIVDIGAFLDRCPRLRLLRVTFRAVEARSLQAALAILESAVALGLTVSLLGLGCNQINNWRRSVNGISVASLLCAAARLSPQELIFTNNSFEHIFANLPSFHCATSAEMELRTFRFTQLLAREFSALERLCLRGCTIVNLVTMLALCPRLRVLKVMVDRSARDVKINSESLQELDLSVYGQLKLKVCSNPDLRVSISTPMVEKNRLGAAVDFALEMEKLPVTNFTVLELYLIARGHVLGAIVRHLLMIHHIQTNTQRLKVFLWDRCWAKCLENCPCDEPKNWRSQSISLTHLEEVEINNFKGGDHEIDLVTMALRWAPRLKTLTIKLADETDIQRCAAKIYDICSVYPFVNCSVYNRAGGLV
ncbi:hypothetical protein VPH35_102390 [Triticum aestivum]